MCLLAAAAVKLNFFPGAASLFSLGARSSWSWKLIGLPWFCSNDFAAKNRKVNICWFRPKQSRCSSLLPYWLLFEELTAFIHAQVHLAQDQDLNAMNSHHKCNELEPNQTGTISIESQANGISWDRVADAQNCSCQISNDKPSHTNPWLCIFTSHDSQNICRVHISWHWHQRERPISKYVPSWT